jgi:hypothetical protein
MDGFGKFDLRHIRSRPPASVIVGIALLGAACQSRQIANGPIAPPPSRTEPRTTSPATATAKTGETSAANQVKAGGEAVIETGKTPPPEAQAEPPAPAPAEVESDLRPVDALLLGELLEKRGYAPPDTFKALVIEIVQDKDGHFIYYPMDYLGTSEDRDDWWPASTVKLFAAVAALEKARAMGFSPRVELTFHYPEGPVTQPLGDLVRRAITDSKNPEFDRLVELVTSDRLNRYFLTAAKGLPRTVMLRAYSRRVLHPESGKSLNSHSPRITLKEGNLETIQEARVLKGEFPCDNNGNCTTLKELAEAMRRVMMQETLPARERYRLGAEQLELLRAAMKGKHARGGVADGLRAAFRDRPIEIFHKAGYADGWFSDNIFLKVNDKGERWIIDMANRPGRDSLNDAALHVATLIATGELSKERERRFQAREAADAGKTPVALDVLSRESWRANPPTSAYVRHRIERLTVHHQGVRFTDSRRAPARLGTMQQFHQSAEKGFNDIAYHFVVDPDGNVYQGRPVWAGGETETDYDPSGHLLVCLLGDFETQSPKPPQLDALVSVLAWAADTFEVSPKTIEGHRDHAHTTCPGKHLHALITDGTIEKRVEERLTEHRVALHLLGGSEGDERILSIRRGEPGQ